VKNWRRQIKCSLIYPQGDQLSNLLDVELVHGDEGLREFQLSSIDLLLILLAYDLLVQIK
jgi:hypothetical protein